MTKELINKLDHLRSEIAESKGVEKEELLQHLETIVLSLQRAQEPVPIWARQRLADRIDETFEAQFDNLPL